jgi:MFS family permease
MNKSKLTDPFSWRFTTPLYLGSTLNPMNSSLLATALVPIALALHVSIAQTTVLISALYLTSAIAQPTSGKLSEEFGPRRVFLAGALAVLIGGLIGAIGNSLTALIVARVCIGIGTATAYPSAMLMIRRRALDSGMKEPPGKVLGGLQIAGSATSALGLPIGGVLVGAWGWRTTFLINIPLGLITIALTARWLKRDAPIGKLKAREVASRIDVLGILLFASTITSLLVFLMSLPQPHWLGLIIAVIAGIALSVWELRAKHPFFDIRLLAKDKALTRTYLRWALITLCIYTVLYGLTQWLQAIRGLSALKAGMLILPMSALSALVVRSISRRNLVRWPLITAAVTALLGSIGVLLLTSTSSLILLVFITLLFGVALGMGASANQTALYKQVRPSQLGTASGLFRTFGYIGSIASSTLISITFHSSVSDHGLHSIGIVMIVVSVAALVLTVADKHLKRTSASAAQIEQEPAI